MVMPAVELVIVIALRICDCFGTATLRIAALLLLGDQALKHLLYLLPFFIAEKEGDPAEGGEGLDDLIHEGFV